jgi:hypothetical protein
MQITLRIYIRVKPFESIEEILEVVKLLEESARIKDGPIANVAKKEDRYKDRRKRAERPWERDKAREGRETDTPYRPVKPVAAVPIKNWFWNQPGE